MESTVRAMRDIVHRRFRIQPITMANVPAQLSEHEKRQLEKAKSLRKLDRGFKDRGFKKKS
jgi:hypothetical protein